jgi:hypothetical protein
MQHFHDVVSSPQASATVKLKPEPLAQAMAMLSISRKSPNQKSKVPLRKLCFRRFFESDDNIASVSISTTLALEVQRKIQLEQQHYTDLEQRFHNKQDVV